MNPRRIADYRWQNALAGVREAVWRPTRRRPRFNIGVIPADAKGAARSGRPCVGNPGDKARPRDPATPVPPAACRRALTRSSTSEGP